MTIENLAKERKTGRHFAVGARDGGFCGLSQQLLRLGSGWTNMLVIRKEKKK
jgi:hypothetical protein